MNPSTDPKDSEPTDLAPTRMIPELPDPPEFRELPPSGDATQSMPAKAPEPPPTQPSSRGWLLWLVLGILGLGAAGALAYGFLMRKRLVETGPGATATAPEAVPPELRPYMDQAKAGDAKAMHMIALMYWNGLNVRQDRVKGLEWYKKAAAAGSTAAQQFIKDNGLR